MRIKNSTTIFTIWITLTMVFLVIPFFPSGILAMINLAFVVASIWSEERKSKNQ